MKHRVINNKCLGCGTCVALCPKSFRIGSDGKSEAIDSTDSDEEILTAAKACPTEAIEVEDDQGKKLWPK